MKSMVAGVSLALFATVACAQERVPQEQASKIAKMLAEQAAKVNDPQVKTHVDTAKAYGLRKEDVGVMVIPDEKLSAEALAHAGKHTLPAGQLWLRNLTPIIDGKVVPGDQLRLATVTVNDQEHQLPLLLLGVRKNADGNLELLAYAKDKKPLLHLPLKKVATKQELPIELEGKEGENETGVLTINLLGQYQAKVPLAAQAP